jgi:hypothetical protein
MNANEITPQLVMLVCMLGLLVLFRIWKKSRSGISASSKSTSEKNATKPVCARMNRIQKVSRLIRVFLQYGFPLLILGMLGFGILAANNIINLPSRTHPAAGPDTTTHVGTGLRGVLTLIVFFFWYRTALKLFGFFEKGILFTAETVRCIQILGIIYFARFVVQLALNFASSPPDWMGTDLSDLFTSFLVIFIGWLIDEARKIREEQELTV